MKDHTDIIVDIREVSKSFPSVHGKIDALVSLTLSINKSEIFGLVGPDGAGKTTLIRMLCTIIRPDHGTICVDGSDVVTDKITVRQKIGYLSQKFSLYGDLTISENIDFFARIHGIRGYTERKQELLQFMRLDKFQDRLAEKLSGGMKQKLALACTLIHTPAIIFLDEPTTGVDPVSRRDFWAILSSLQKEGLTIFISTPYLDEAERCHRVALMDKGSVIQCAPPKELKTIMKNQLFEISCVPLRHARKALQENPLIIDTQSFGDRLHIQAGATITAEQITEILVRKSVQDIHIRKISPSLEDVFIHLLQDVNHTKVKTNAELEVNS